jgi:hypothetical protein
VDEDEDEEPEERESRRRKEKKRRREREEEEAVLDEEDLDLIGEANPEWERKTTNQVCLVQFPILGQHLSAMLIFPSLSSNA